MITIEVIRSAVALGEALELTYGDTLRINTAFRHQGPAQSIALSGAIGNRGAEGFTAILHTEVPYSVEESTELADYSASVDIPITGDIEPGSGYDIRCEILEHPEAGAPGVDDVITITGVPPVEKPGIPYWLIGVALGLGTLALAAKRKKV